MFDFVTVSEAATQIGQFEGHRVNPRRITEAIYRGAIDPGRCPLVSGRRLIPRDMIPLIRDAIATRSSRRRATANG